jgi:hypothetical protein
LAYELVLETVRNGHFRNRERVMEWFDAFEELMATIERFVSTNGHAPTEVAVSPQLYAWLADIRRESARLSGTPLEDLSTIPTPHGPVRLQIDEALNAYEIVPD